MAISVPLRHELKFFINPVDAEVLRLEDGDLAEVSLGDEVGALHLHQDGAALLLFAGQGYSTSSADALFFQGNSRLAIFSRMLPSEKSYVPSRPCGRKIMTRISTMA